MMSREVSEAHSIQPHASPLRLAENPAENLADNGVGIPAERQALPDDHQSQHSMPNLTDSRYSNAFTFSTFATNSAQHIMDGTQSQILNLSESDANQHFLLH